MHEAHAKALAYAVPNTLGPVAVIGAPGAGIRIQLHRATAVPDAASAGLLSLQSPSGTNIWTASSGTTILQNSIDFAGFTLGTNVGLFVALSNAVNWRLTVLYSLVAQTS